MNGPLYIFSSDEDIENFVSQGIEQDMLDGRSGQLVLVKHQQCAWHYTRRPSPCSEYYSNDKAERHSLLCFKIYVERQTEIKTHDTGCLALLYL